MTAPRNLLVLEALEGDTWVPLPQATGTPAQWIEDGDPELTAAVELLVLGTVPTVYVDGGVARVRLVQEWAWSPASDLPWTVTAGLGAPWLSRVDPGRGLAVRQVSA